MTDKERLSVKNKYLKVISAWLAVLLCLLALTGCSKLSPAEKKVSNELKALQSSETVGSEVVNLRNSLSDEGKEHFDGFLDKLRNFDFEITGQARQVRFGIRYDPGTDSLELRRVKITAEHILYRDSLLRHAVISLLLVLLAGWFVLRTCFPSVLWKFFPLFKKSA